MNNPIVDFVKSELAARQAKNPRYSLRAFSESLGIASATLSQILKGKRNLTFATAQQILEQLKVDAVKRNTLLLTFADPQSYTPAKTNFRVLTESELEAIAGWQFYALLCAFELPDQHFTEEEVSRKIGCDLSLVQSSIKLLMDLNLLRKERERFIPTGEKLTTTNHIPSKALVRAHRDYLNRAIEVLESRDGPKESDFTGITMTVAKDKLPEAARRIRDFRRSLAAFLGEGKQDEVYRINIQLFPLK